MIGLLLLLLEVSLWPLVLVALAAVGMFIGLMLFDRLYAYEVERADRVEAERPTLANVLDLAEWRSRRRATA